MTKEQIKEIKKDVDNLKHLDVPRAIRQNMPEELKDIWRCEKFDDLTDEDIKEIHNAVVTTVDSWIELTQEAQNSSGGFSSDVKMFTSYREDLEDFNEKWENKGEGTQWI